METTTHEDQGWTETGIAMLCFDPSGQTFQGRLITPNGKQYGLMGKSCGPPPDGHFHQCCFDEDPIFFQISVIDFQRRSEVSLDYTMKTNGDNCSLTSANLDFSTDEMFVGQKAEDRISKFFSKSLLGKDCHICVGQWNMKATFPYPKEQESDEEDTDF